MRLEDRKILERQHGPADRLDFLHTNLGVVADLADCGEGLAGEMEVPKNMMARHRRDQVVAIQAAIQHMLSVIMHDLDEIARELKEPER